MDHQFEAIRCTSVSLHTVSGACGENYGMLNLLQQ